MANKSEGLPIARLLMVLSSISPLFILWAIRGANVKGLPESYFLAFCALIPRSHAPAWERIRSLTNLIVLISFGKKVYTLN